MDMEKLNLLYAVDKTQHALYGILNFFMTDKFCFLFFKVIITTTIVMFVNFVKKNHKKNYNQRKKSD